MEYEQMKEWLDALIANAEQAMELEEFNSSIKASTSPFSFSRKILIPRGIDIVADVMGIPLTEIELPADEVTYSHKYKYQFLYRDVLFFTYEKERLEGMAYVSV